MWTIPSSRPQVFLAAEGPKEHSPLVFRVEIALQQRRWASGPGLSLKQRDGSWSGGTKRRRRRVKHAKQPSRVASKEKERRGAAVGEPPSKKAGKRRARYQADYCMQSVEPVYATRTVNCCGYVGCVEFYFVFWL